VLLINYLDKIFKLLIESFAEPGVYLVIVILKLLQILKFHDLNIILDEFLDLLIHRFN
jgi:hypothetical protein